MLARLLAGDVRSIARLITLIENDDPRAQAYIKELYPYTGKAVVIGITGPPGAGKSTLTAKVAQEFRRRKYQCGLILVDPSSPFTGGAVLGDRVRMPELTMDPGVFARSMGTRGNLGGLAPATHDAVKVLDAAGKDVVIVETVGIGQAETDVVQAADLVIVVSVPGLGDQIQTLKSGIMEIGDIFVVNKADRAGAQRTMAELRMMLDLSGLPEDQKPPLLKTVATTGEGVLELVDTIEDRLSAMSNNGELERKRRVRAESQLRTLLQRRLLTRVEQCVGAAALQKFVDQIIARQLDPYTAVDQLISKLKGGL